MTDYYPWIVFNVFVIILLIFDLYISKGKIYKFKSALIWSLCWVSISMIVALWFFVEDGSLMTNNERGVSFLAGYIAEKALCFDNLFVFIIIFEFFQIPAKLQSLALTYGIMGALITRAIFIALGSIILSNFGWVLLIMGIFLIYTGIKISLVKESDSNPENNLIYRIANKFVNVSSEFDGSRFRTNINGVKKFTPMFLVVIVLASTDIVFAIDSIPTIFGITQDVFIVWTSNMMAVIGMRPLYFLIQEIQNQFRFLKYGLSLILVFIGFKMSMEYLGEKIGPLINSEYITHFHINTYISLGTIVGIITVSILLSNIIKEKDGSKNIK